MLGVVASEREMKSLTNGGSGRIDGINNRRARRVERRDSNYLIHCYAAGAPERSGKKEGRSPNGNNLCSEHAVFVFEMSTTCGTTFAFGGREGLRGTDWQESAISITVV